MAGKAVQLICILIQAGKAVSRVRRRQQRLHQAPPRSVQPRRQRAAVWGEQQAVCQASHQHDMSSVVARHEGNIGRGRPVPNQSSLQSGDGAVGPVPGDVGGVGRRWQQRGIGPPYYVVLHEHAWLRGSVSQVWESQAARLIKSPSLSIHNLPPSLQ